MNLVIGGTYRHYKGNYYTLVGIAKHSETLEELVIYEAQYGDRALWARPLKMFFDKVIVNGNKVNRFELIDNDLSKINN